MHCGLYSLVVVARKECVEVLAKQLLMYGGYASRKERGTEGFESSSALHTKVGMLAMAQAVVNECEIQPRGGRGEESIPTLLPTVYILLQNISSG